MKFRLTMKTPDVLDDVLNEMTDNETHDGEDFLDVINEASTFAKKYIKNGEYLIVEFDTDAQTAIVVPV